MLEIFLVPRHAGFSGCGSHVSLWRRLGRISIISPREGWTPDLEVDSRPLFGVLALLEEYRNLGFVGRRLQETFFIFCANARFDSGYVHLRQSSSAVWTYFLFLREGGPRIRGRFLYCSASESPEEYKTFLDLLGDDF